MNTRPYILFYSFLLVCLLFCLGLTSKQDNKIPIPLDTYSGTIKDRAGVETEASDISIEGRTFLTSRHGKGVLFVEFKEIKEIRFHMLKKGEVAVTISLITGDTMQGNLNCSEDLYGSAKFGKLKIKVKEVETITFHTNR